MHCERQDDWVEGISSVPSARLCLTDPITWRLPCSNSRVCGLTRTVSMVFVSFESSAGGRFPTGIEITCLRLSFVIVTYVLFLSIVSMLFSLQHARSLKRNKTMISFLLKAKSRLPEISMMVDGAGLSMAWLARMSTESVKIVKMYKGFNELG